MLDDVRLLDFMQTICFSFMKNIFKQSGSVLNRIWLVLSHIITYIYIHCFDMFWYFQLHFFWDDDPPFFGGMAMKWLSRSPSWCSRTGLWPRKRSVVIDGYLVGRPAYIIIYLYYYIYIYIIYIWSIYDIYDLYTIYLYVHIYVLCINQAVPESTHLSIAHIFVL